MTIIREGPGPFDCFPKYSGKILKKYSACKKVRKRGRVTEGCGGT